MYQKTANIRPIFWYHTASEWSRQGCLGPLPEERDITKLTPTQLEQARA